MLSLGELSRLMGAGGFPPGGAAKSQRSPPKNPYFYSFLTGVRRVSHQTHLQAGRSCSKQRSSTLGHPHPTLRCHPPHVPGVLGGPCAAPHRPDISPSLLPPQPVGFVSFDSRSEAEAAKNALNVSAPQRPIHSPSLPQISPNSPIPSSCMSPAPAGPAASRSLWPIPIQHPWLEPHGFDLRVKG